LRARPEQTQSEDLSDASFLGKLLVLPANVRLDWKAIARHKFSSLFGLDISDEGKKFDNIDTWPGRVTFSSTTLTSFLEFCEKGYKNFLGDPSFCQLALLSNTQNTYFHAIGFFHE